MRIRSAKDRRYRILSISAFGSVPYNKQTTTENRDFRKDFPRAQHGYQQAKEMTTQINPEEDGAVFNNYYQPEYNENSSNKQIKLLMPRHRTDQTNKHVLDITIQYYTKNFNIQPTDFRQDQKATTTAMTQTKSQEEHPTDAPQQQANVPMQTTVDNQTTCTAYNTKHKKSPTQDKDVAIHLLSATLQLNKKSRMLYIPLYFQQYDNHGLLDTGAIQSALSEDELRRILSTHIAAL